MKAVAILSCALPPDHPQASTEGRSIVAGPWSIAERMSRGRYHASGRATTAVGMRRSEIIDAMAIVNIFLERRILIASRAIVHESEAA